MSRTSANYVSKTYHTALKPNSCWNLRRPLALRHLSSCQWKICKNTDPTLQSRLLWNLPTCASTPAPPCKSLTWTSCTVGASTTSGTVGASATSGTVSASATSVSNISDWLTASKGGQDSSESPRFSWHGSEAFYSTRQWQLVRSPCRTGPSGSQPLFDFVSFFVFFFVLLVDVALAAVIVALQCCTSFVPYPTETGDIDSWWSSPAAKLETLWADFPWFSGQIQGKIDKSSYHVKPTVQKPKSLLTSALSLARASSPTVHCQWIDVDTPGRCQKCLGHVMSCWGHIRM